MKGPRGYPWRALFPTSCHFPSKHRGGLYGSEEIGRKGPQKQTEAKANKKWCSCKFPKGAGQVSGPPGGCLLTVRDGWPVGCPESHSGCMTRLLAGPGTEDPRWNP